MSRELQNLYIRNSIIPLTPFLINTSKIWFTASMKQPGLVQNCAHVEQHCILVSRWKQGIWCEFCQAGLPRVSLPANSHELWCLVTKLLCWAYLLTQFAEAGPASRYSIMQITWTWNTVNSTLASFSTKTSWSNPKIKINIMNKAWTH